MTMTRAQALVLLEPKISTLWNDSFTRRPSEWQRFVNVRTTQKATVTDQNMTMFGGFQLKPEAQNISYDDWIIGNSKQYSPVRFALGYRVTYEMRKNDLYGQVDRLEGGLLDSARDTQEQTAALIFNNGFGTTDADGFTAAGFDGLALFSTAHTRLDGGTTQRNRPSTDVDLSVTGVQNAIVDIDNWVNHRGRPILFRPELLIINPDDQFTAKEILGSELKPGTANNELNALKDAGLSYMISHYLTDSDAWFIKCDQHDVNWIWSEQPHGEMDEDFDADIIKRKVTYGQVCGHGEWFGYYGSQGA